MPVDFDLIAFDFMTDFNGPERHYPKPFYPSGVYESDSPVYKHGPASIEYPTLTLPCSLFDTYGNEVPDGFYTATVSSDRKYILLYCGRDLKARIKIVKIVEKMYTDDELREEDKIIAKLEDAKKRKKLKKVREAEEELSAFKDKIAALSYAEIVDSGEGYYIINYRYLGITAKAVIQK